MEYVGFLTSESKLSCGISGLCLKSDETTGPESPVGACGFFDSPSFFFTFFLGLLSSRVSGVGDGGRLAGAGLA